MKKLIFTTFHDTEAGNLYRKALYDLKAKLTELNTNKIIAFIEWNVNGEIKRGYKILNGLDTCFTLFSAKNADWIVEDENLTSLQVHNRGINKMVFRELKNNESQRDITGKQLDGTITLKDLAELTLPIGEKILNILYPKQNNQTSSELKKDLKEHKTKKTAKNKVKK